ncbi:hypothetical protein EK904_009733, partial [Melospiza melodia maxima]
MRSKSNLKIPAEGHLKSHLRAIQHAVEAEDSGVNPVGNFSNKSSHWDLGGAFFFAGTVITTI